MESTGAPSHPLKSRDIVLTEQSRTMSLDERGLSPREGSEGLSQRARTVGEFRRSSSSSMRDVVVVEARRRRNCPRKSHNVKLEIGRAQAGKQNPFAFASAALASASFVASRSPPRLSPPPLSHRRQDLLSPPPSPTPRSRTLPHRPRSMPPPRCGR